MVINHLDVIDAIFAPLEADAPLLVDTYAVLSVTVAFQSFQSVRWRHTQIGKSGRSVKHDQLSLSNSLDVTGQSFNEATLKDCSCLLILE